MSHYDKQTKEETDYHDERTEAEMVHYDKQTKAETIIVTNRQ